MAVKPQHQNESLELTFTNGDKEKLNEVLNDWQFKDYQSLMRFMSSIMLLANDHDLWIKNEEGIPQRVLPSEHLLKPESPEINRC